jgi:hypothetical protein
LSYNVEIKDGCPKITKLEMPEKISTENYYMGWKDMKYNVPGWTFEPSTCKIDYQLTTTDIPTELNSKTTLKNDVQPNYMYFDPTYDYLDKVKNLDVYKFPITVSHRGGKPDVGDKLSRDWPIKLNNDACEKPTHKTDDKDTAPTAKVDAYIDLTKDITLTYGITDKFTPDFCYPSKYKNAALPNDLQTLVTAGYVVFDTSKHPAEVTVKKNFPLDKIGSF